MGTGRTTADMLSGVNKYQGPHSTRHQKHIKIVIDNNHTFVINVPDKIPIIEDDHSCGINSSGNHGLE